MFDNCDVTFDLGSWIFVVKKKLNLRKFKEELMMPFAKIEF